MDRLTKALIAIASVIVIAAGSTYIMGEASDYREAKAQELAAKAAERERAEAWLEDARAKKAAKERAEIDACARDLDAYDNRNDSSAFVQRATSTGKKLSGEAMLAEVSACRELLNSSKPSELHE